MARASTPLPVPLGPRNITETSACAAREITSITPRIAGGDFLTKIRHAEEFLSHGNKVKLRLKFRGREMAHTEIGFALMQKALAELEGMGHPDNQAKLMGKQINIMLTPLPENKRKRKYTLEADEQAIDDTGSDHDHDDNEAQAQA